MIAGHHSMMTSGTASSVFRYLGIKAVAARFYRLFESASAMRASSDAPNGGTMIQFYKIEFLDANGAVFDLWGADPTRTIYFYDKNGRQLKTGPVIPLKFGSVEGTAWTNAFDPTASGNGAYKVCGWSALIHGGCSTSYHGAGKALNFYELDAEPETATSCVWAHSNTSIRYIQNVTPETTVRDNGVFGYAKKDWFTSHVLVLDFGAGGGLDISTYNRWHFYNADDNASQFNRTWIEGEILGSVDGKTWWRLDAFNDTSIPNTNKALAYTGSLVPRKGDLWSDLDLDERDWANGIKTD